jgi:hypothetical protein
MLSTISAALIVSDLAGVSWTMVRASGISSVVYLSLFALAFGWPVYILTRMILAKTAKSHYSIHRKK